MPNVSKNVFQTIQGATKSNRDISAKERTEIKNEMEKDGGIDSEEQSVLNSIDRGSKFTVQSGTQSATISPKEVSFPSSQNVDAQAQGLVDANTDHGVVFDDLLEEDLGKNLAKTVNTRLNNAPVALAALKKANDNEVVLSLVQNLTDTDLNRLSENSGGKDLLRFSYSELNANRTNSDEGKAMQRIVAAASSSHGHLAGAEFNVPPKVTAALKATGATLQPMSEGSTLNSPNYDTYKVTVNLPSDEKARELFEKFARNPNDVGDNYFDAMNDFTLRGGGGKALPAVGDIYDIDIMGPDNGSVMVIDGSLSDTEGHIVVATIDEAKYGSHPENGVREFGFHKNDNGSYTFYTKGASRGANTASQTGGAVPQEQSWRGLIDGFQSQAVQMGGSVVNARSQTNTSTPF